MRKRKKTVAEILMEINNCMDIVLSILTKLTLAVMSIATIWQVINVLF